MPEKPHPSILFEDVNSMHRISESIMELLQLSSRVDERVQILMKKNQDLEEKIDEQTGIINELNSKIRVLESKDTNAHIRDKVRSQEFRTLADEVKMLNLRIHSLENSSNHQEDRWKTIVGFVIQLAWVILASFLLYRLGISSPPVP